MSNEIIKILDDLAKRFGVAIDWTAENVMPYLKDLFGRVVTYKIVYDSVLIAISCLAIVACLIVGIKLYNERKTCAKMKKDTMFHSYYEWRNSVELKEGAGYALTSGTIVVGFFSILNIGWCVNDLIGWSFIPEFKIIEWISDKLTMLGG